MSFERLSRRILRRPTEKYILQTRILYDKDRKNKVLKDEIGNIVTKDDVGNIKEEWMDIEELSGVIQHRQYEKEKNRVLSISESGIESTIRYFGYFDPTFNLNTNKLDDYRVKFVRDYETLYLKIIEYDANNYLRGKHHHIVLGMDEDRKYYGRQRDRKNAKIDVNIPSFAQLGEDINVDISIPEDAEGYIVINKTKIPIQSNNISTVISDLPLGRNIIKIIYSGDKNYNKSIIKKEIDIKGDLIVSTSDIKKYYRGPERFVVSITDYNNNIIPNQRVFLYIHKSSYERVTNDKGTVSIPLNLEPDTYTIITKVNDQEIENQIEILSTIIPAYEDVYDNASDFYAILYDVNGNIPPINTECGFFVNGQNYVSKTNDKGIAYLDADLTNGTYDVTIANLLNGEYVHKKITIEKDNEIFIDAPAIESKFGEKKFFVVSLTNRKGNPVTRKSIEIVLQEIVDDEVTYQVVMKPITDYYGQFNYSTKSLSPGYYRMTITVNSKSVTSSIKIIE